MEFLYPECGREKKRKKNARIVAAVAVCPCVQVAVLSEVRALETGEAAGAAGVQGDGVGVLGGRAVAFENVNLAVGVFFEIKGPAVLVQVRQSCKSMSFSFFFSFFWCYVLTFGKRAHVSQEPRLTRLARYHMRCRACAECQQLAGRCQTSAWTPGARPSCRCRRWWTRGLCCLRRCRLGRREPRPDPSSLPPPC